MNATPAASPTTWTSTATTIPSGNESLGLDRPVVSVVEESPASFVSHRLGLGELRDEDLGSILRCLNSLHYTEKTEKILRDIADGYKAVFRLSPGLMILEILKRGNDRELFVYWLEGKNMFRQLRYIKKAVETIAEANGCTRLSTVVHDERWAKKLLKTFNGRLAFSLSTEL